MVNDSIITLIPKNPGALALKDFRPISLIHLVRKLFSKVLSTRLAPRLGSLIHPSQSAFIRGRVIQDNFWYVHSATKLLHARKKSSLLLKVDISRAFDSVAWPFLLEVMQHISFSLKWTDWMSTLLSTASTRVCLNDTQGDRICHAQGLRQGDPILPMLFMLVMEVLDALIHKADEWDLFSRLRVQSVRHHTSLYADDFIMFTSPTLTDLQLCRTIFQAFEKASRLGV
jgi:hypothetical protein